MIGFTPNRLTAPWIWISHQSTDSRNPSPHDQFGENTTPRVIVSPSSGSRSTFPEVMVIGVSWIPVQGFATPVNPKALGPRI